MTYVVAERDGDRWIVTWLRGRLSDAWLSAAIDDAIRSGAQRVRIVYISSSARALLADRRVP